MFKLTNITKWNDKTPIECYEITPNGYLKIRAKFLFTDFDRVVLSNGYVSIRITEKTRRRIQAKMDWAILVFFSRDLPVFYHSVESARRQKFWKAFVKARDKLETAIWRRANIRYAGNACEIVKQRAYHESYIKTLDLAVDETGARVLEHIMVEPTHERYSVLATRRRNAELKKT